MSEQNQQDLETTGPGDAAERIGQAPTATDDADPQRASRNTAAGTDSVEPAADQDVDTSASIEPRNEGQV